MLREFLVCGFFCLFNNISDFRSHFIDMVEDHTIDKVNLLRVKFFSIRTCL